MRVHFTEAIKILEKDIKILTVSEVRKKSLGLIAFLDLLKKKKQVTEFSILYRERMSGEQNSI